MADNKQEKKSPPVVGTQIKFAYETIKQAIFKDRKSK